MSARVTIPDRLRSRRTGIDDSAAEWQDWECVAPDDSDAAGASGWEHTEPPGWEPEEQCGTDGWFAYGGLADGLRPGPLLASLAEDAWTAGLDRLADDELIGVMRAARRLASWAGALEVDAAGDLWRRRWAAEQAGATGAARHADDEIAAALTLTGRAADQLLSLAVALRRLPRTSEALAAADIDMPRAMVIADEVTALDDEHAAAVEQRIIDTAPVQTTGQLRAATRRAVMAADPTAARRRKERALQDARVERWDEHAGTAALAGRDLPPASVLAADQNLSALARQLQAAGAAGTLDHLRAQIYLALLTGVPVNSLLPVRCSATEGSAGPGGSAAWLEPREPGTASGAGGSAASDRGDDPADSGRAGAMGQSCGLTGSVNLTMPLATWLGLSDAPGCAAGSGALDADDSRALAELLAERADSNWQSVPTVSGASPSPTPAAAPWRTDAPMRDHGEARGPLSGLPGHPADRQPPPAPPPPAPDRQLPRGTGREPVSVAVPAARNRA